MATPELHNHHNVYILGAGFSADAGLPIIAKFMAVMRLAASKYAEEGCDEERDAIATVLEYRLRAAAAAYRCPIDPDNIEDLFSLIDAEEGTGGPADYNKKIRLAIAGTIDYAHRGYAATPTQLAAAFDNAPGITDCARWKKHPSIYKQHLMPLYDAYLAAMIGCLYERPPERRDTIISFNYDTLVEDALTHLDRPYSYGFLTEEYTDGKGGGFVTYDTKDLPLLRKGYQQEGAIDVLKLHGSVNWGLRSTQSEFVHTKGQAQTFNELIIYPTFNNLRANDIDRIFIEPPTWRKGQNAPGGGIASVWSAALKGLRAASRIVIMGYSLPLTDVHFRYLLAAGLRENISLQEIIFVNHDLTEGTPKYDAMVSRIFQVLRRELHDRQIIQFVGQDIYHALIPASYGPVASTAASAVFAKLNPNAGNRLGPFSGSHIE